MSTTHVPLAPRFDALRAFGRGVVLVWAGFWVGFSLLSGVGELPSEGLGAFISHLIPALLIGLSALVGWQGRITGALALLGMAAGLGFVYAGAQPLVKWLLLLPPVLAALCLLASCLLARGRKLPATH